MKKIISLLISLLILTSTIVLTKAQTSIFSEEHFIIPTQYLASNLSINPTFYDFGDITIGDFKITTFEVWNSACCTLQYSIFENCSWLSITPFMGTSHGEHDIITVSLETNSLEPGSYQYDLQITSNGGNKSFRVSVNCIRAGTPKITLSPRTYDFGNEIIGATPSTSFDVWNCGIDSLSYSLVNIPAWIEASPKTGTSTGEHDTITITIDTSHLTIGPHTQYIDITSNGGEISFKFSIYVKNTVPELSYSPHSYDFGYKELGETDLTAFDIWNSGVDKLTYTLVENCDWITVDPTYGVSSGEVDTIIVRIDTTGLTQRYNIYNISINTNAGTGNFTVTVLIGELYTNITVQKAYSMLTDVSNGIQIPIDVREDYEWVEEHIDTPAPENPRHHCVCEMAADEAVLQAFIELYQGRDIILYSLGVSRSITAANLLIEHYFNGTIYIMLGGLTAWKQAGYPTKVNMPPNTPVITGDAKGKPGEEYHYTFTTTDVDQDDVYYYINWSDNTTNQLVGPYHSGEEATISHVWSEKGTYTVKVKARDIYGSESDYATLEIKMPYSYNPIHQFFDWLFQQFPNAYPLLRQLLGY